jgi:hypothetical protein
LLQLRRWCDTSRKVGSDAERGEERREKKKADRIKKEKR